MESFRDKFFGQLLSTETCGHLLTIEQRRDSTDKVWFTCTLPWEEVVEDGQVKLLELLIDYHPKIDLIWFDPCKTYKGHMPFDIDSMALLSGQKLLIMVYGQESPKIKKKWESRLGNSFKYTVSLSWLNVREDDNLLEMP